MIIRVDPDAALPVYEQIRTQVQRMAVTGILPAGTRLPTIRQLAADLGLAKGTISRAYELLETDRVVQAMGRKGTFIAEQPELGAAERSRQMTAAAEAFVVAAKQLGADTSSAHAALEQAWQTLE